MTALTTARAFEWRVDLNGVTVTLENGDQVVIDGDALVDGGWIYEDDHDCSLECDEPHCEDLGCGDPDSAEGQLDDVRRLLKQQHADAGHVGAWAFCTVEQCRALREAVGS